MLVRDAFQRKKHVLDRLEHDRDVWVATADVEGRAHLVPFSLSWDGIQVITATNLDSITARNVLRSHQARLALADTRDVVILDVSVEVTNVDRAPQGVCDQFITRNGWDPREAAGKWAYFLMIPMRVQAWESEEELNGRNIMVHGKWLA
jgi:hypothetical protein